MPGAASRAWHPSSTVRRVLVTGMSGTGKSSALAALAALGHRVVDTDYDGWGDPWDAERMAALLAEDGETLIVSGTVANQVRFYDRFDAVVLLSAPAEVLLERVAGRTGNPYGKSEAEQEEILGYLVTVEPLLRAGATHELDASRPLDDVVAALDAIARDEFSAPGQSRTTNHDSEEDGP